MHFLRVCLTLVFCSTLFYATGQEVLQYFSAVESLDSLNTSFDEGSFSIHPDGQSILYTVKLHPENVGGKFNPGDLWNAGIDQEFTKGAPTANIDPGKLITPLGFVNQGELILFSATAFDRGVYEGEVLLGDYEEGSITNPRKLDIPYFNNISEHQSGSISANGQHLLLSMESTSSYGVEDLYVCHLQSDGSWSSPKNLGYRINTAFQEYTPFLAPDNETLFFSSNGRDDGQGSFDIYMSSRADDTWQNWTAPKNIGTPVNTNGSETSFQLSPDGVYAYYVSTTDSDGYGDIKRIRIESDFVADTSDMVVIEVQQDVERYDRYVQLVNEETLEVISGNLVMVSDSAQIQSNIPGLTEIEFLDDYQVQVNAAGYLSKQQLLTEKDILDSDTLFFSLEPLEVGITIQLKNVLFYQGTSNFIEGSAKELNLVVSMLEQNPEVKIALAGHTDNVGDPVLNLELSNERVKVVRDYLISKGVDFQRIGGKGYGGSQPLVPNNSESNRRLNRRVEFTIVEN
jgi:OOP family OmpA-OmpF porin